LFREFIVGNFLYYTFERKLDNELRAAFINTAGKKSMMAEA
jgi:hypothetical protein